MEDSAISPIYVIGHLNPDTDSIASAVGYAWLLHERDGKNAIAARAGTLNAQTSWLLQTIGFEPPLYLPDASPRFSRIARPLPPVLPDRPLQEALIVLSTSSIGVPIVGPDNKPLGLVTGTSVFKFLSRSIKRMIDLEKVPVGRLLAINCSDAMDNDIPKFRLSMRVRDGRRRVMNEERNDFLVINDDGTYYGVCRTPDVLNPPRMQIIQVDHNEPTQTIRAFDEADLIEVIDHHRLAAQYTKTPVPFTIDSVGSTSTLIWERIAVSGLTPSPQVTALLLAGILSDTLVLSSPTTTNRDRKTVARLMERVTESKLLPYKNYKEFGEALFSVSSSLSVLSIDTILTSDLKMYEAGGIKFGIAQIEASNLVELGGRIKEICVGLNKLCETNELEFAVLMVTDVVRVTSRLVLGGNEELLNDLPYTQLHDGTLDASGIVSRKKQLLPTILGLLE